VSPRSFSLTFVQPAYEDDENITENMSATKMVRDFI
jgi:hypothetical protein